MTYMVVLILLLIPVSSHAQSVVASDLIEWTFPSYATNPPEETVVSCFGNGQQYEASIPYPQSSVRIENVLGHHQEGMYDCNILVKNGQSIGVGPSLRIYASGEQRQKKTVLPSPSTIRTR